MFKLVFYVSTAIDADADHFAKTVWKQIVFDPNDPEQVARLGADIAKFVGESYPLLMGNATDYSILEEP